MDFFKKMEFKTDPNSELAKYAKDYWDNIDVDKFALVLHGPPQTEDEKAWAEAEMAKVNELARLYKEKCKTDDMAK
jgi:hypothetical protein